MRKEIQRVSQSLSDGFQQQQTAGPRKTSAVDRLYSRLLAFDFSEEFSRDLILAATNSPEAATSEFETLLRQTSSAHGLVEPSAKKVQAELESRLEIDARVGRAGALRRVVLFVGPPGAGKTTTIVKLAVQLGLQQQLPLQFLSLDTVRVAGAEQLSAFGKILGVGFEALHTTEALAKALDNHRDKMLILIDSPGYAAADTEEMERIAAFFHDHTEIEVQLVLPATLRKSALTKFAQRFAAFGPSKLVYTHLDEVDTLGPLLENAIVSRLPVSFLTNGQSIPQDLYAATKAQLTEGLFDNARAATFTAA